MLRVIGCTSPSTGHRAPRPIPHVRFDRRKPLHNWGSVRFLPCNRRRPRSPHQPFRTPLPCTKNSRRRNKPWPVHLAPRQSAAARSRIPPEELTYPTTRSKTARRTSWSVPPYPFCRHITPKLTSFYDRQPWMDVRGECHHIAPLGQGLGTELSSA